MGKQFDPARTDIDAQLLGGRYASIAALTAAVPPSSVQINSRAFTSDSREVINTGSAWISTSLRAKLPRNVNASQAVMSSPPTTTYTTAHTIASPRYWALNTNAAANAVFTGQSFNYCKAAGPAITGTTSPLYNDVKMTSVNYGNAQSANVVQWSFMAYATNIEIVVQGKTSQFLCKVDDQYITLTPQAVANDGQVNYFYIPFGSLNTRRIDFICNDNGNFGGVYTAQTEWVGPAAIRGPRAIIVGDSFIENSGVTAGSIVNYPCYMADALGWDDIMSSGVGSTGFLAAPNPKFKYRDRLATDVYPYNPDIVFFQMSVNDGSNSLAAQTAEWTAVVAAMRANLPNTILGFIGLPLFTGPGRTQQNAWQYHAAAKAFCAANGVIFISASDMTQTAGATLLSTTLSSGCSALATSISTVAALTVNEVYQFADGSRFLCTAVSGVGPFTCTIDQSINAQSSGAAITQVGHCLWTGSGKVGTTTGDGTCDTLVSADGLHPANEKPIGEILAQELLRAVGGSYF